MLKILENRTSDHSSGHFVWRSGPRMSRHDLSPHRHRHEAPNLGQAGPPRPASEERGLGHLSGGGALPRTRPAEEDIISVTSAGATRPTANTEWT